jgi:Trypsin-like peptidase domain
MFFGGGGGIIPLHQVTIKRYTLAYGPGLNRGPSSEGIPMPRLKDEILDCVVYLYGSVHEADEGINTGGSGFTVAIECERPELASLFHTYAVTNRHVIESGATCVRFNTVDGRRLVVEAKKSDWYQSDEDDLAVAPMPEMPTPIAMNAIPQADLITEEMLAQHDVGVGDDVLMLGRFINREGLQRNAPTARFGHISQMPSDPIQIDIGGKTVIQEGALLCEVRSIGGYSGSPVFLLPNPTYGRKGVPLRIDRGIVLGVDFCHVPNWVEAYDDIGHKLPHIRVPLNSGMAGVIPAWKLRNLIMSKKPLAQRRLAEEVQIHKRKSPMAVADAAVNVPPATDVPPSDRERFNSLLSAAAQKHEQED